MYSVSENFLENLDKKQHHLRGTISIDTEEGKVTIPFNEDNLRSDSFQISEQCVSGAAFEIGAVCSRELSMTIILPEIREYALLGAEIFAEFGIEDEWIPLGKFYITKPKKRRDYTEITACDAIGLIDMRDDVSDPVINYLSSSQQPYDVLYRICSYSGVILGNTRNDIESMPSGTSYVYVPDDTEITSTRDILSYIAVFLSGFAITDRYGRIVIKQHTRNTESVLTLENNMIKANSTAVSDFQMILCGAIIYLDEGQSWSKSWYPDVEGKPNSTIIDTSDNPFMIGYYFLNGKDLEALFAPLDAIAEQCINVKWIPFECEYYGNPALDAGDCITIEDYDGSHVVSVISHNTFRFRNTQYIRCVGEDSRIMKGTRTENKRLYEIMEKKINFTKGKNVTESEMDAIIQSGKFAEGQLFYIYDEQGENNNV